MSWEFEDRVVMMEKVTSFAVLRCDQCQIVGHEGEERRGIEPPTPPGWILMWTKVDGHGSDIAVCSFACLAGWVAVKEAEKAVAA